MSRKYLLLIFLFFISKIDKIIAQTQGQYFTSAEIGYGKMLIPENKNLLNDRIPSLDLSLAISTQNRTDVWIKKMNVSYKLITLTYMNQRDLDGMLDTAANSFGDVYMLTYSLMINILGKEKSHFYFIPGWGIAYDTKTFYENNNNIYIGSHFNYAIRLEGMLTHQINKNILFLTGLKYMHYSNGSFILPNRGINSVSLKLGLAYQFNK